MVAAAGVRPGDLLPIAATTADRDLFVMALRNDGQSTEVSWFAGELIDRFLSFEQFCLAMMDYNRAEVLCFETKP